MKVTTKKLQELLKQAKFLNVPNITFDWVDVISTATIKSNWKDINVLSFLFYLPDPDKEGWYDSPIDKRDYIEKQHTAKNVVFVVDTFFDTSFAKENNLSIIIVEDLFNTAKAIFDFVLNEVKPKVVGVTGSVGKTTAVGMLEDVLGIYGKTLRVYSKRISPLSLFTAIINYLEYDHTFIVMEYSLYRKWHVECLGTLLKPTVAAFLNINSVHVDIDGISNDQDIFDAKSKLLDCAEIRILSDDLSRFVYKKSNVRYFGSKSTEIIPYVVTELAFKHSLMCVEIILALGLIVSKEAIDKIENFQPKESRLLVIKKPSKTIIFDGEVSQAARLYELSKNYYDNSMLVVLNVAFGNEPMESQFENLIKTFSNFSKVYIASNFSGSNQIFDSVCRKSSNVVIMESPLRYALSLYNTVFIHDGGYWRYRSHEPLPVPLD